MADEESNPKEETIGSESSSTSPAHKRPRTKKQSSSLVVCPENDSWILLSQGAEARVWKVPKSLPPPPPQNDDGKSNSSDCEFFIVKERFSKAYRHPTLDERLTKQRCRMEGRLLEKCQSMDALKGYVPRVLRVESPLLHLEYIHGITVKDYINNLLETENGINNNDRLTQVASEMGRLIGTLHTVGNMTHGDLTTSNLLMNQTDDTFVSSSSSFPPPHLYLIDFGLAKPLNQASSSNKKKGNAVTNLEEMAVDLYVLERALQSTHPQLEESFWHTLIQAYAAVEQQHLNIDTDNNENRQELSTRSPTLQRLEQVRQRGRKRECFG